MARAFLLAPVPRARSSGNDLLGVEIPRWRDHLGELRRDHRLCECRVVVLVVCILIWKSRLRCGATSLHGRCRFPHAVSERVGAFDSLGNGDHARSLELLRRVALPFRRNFKKRAGHLVGNAEGSESTQRSDEILTVPKLLLTFASISRRDAGRQELSYFT